MTLDNWLTLLAAVVPSVLILVYKGGGTSRQLSEFADDIQEFRQENKELFRESHLMLQAHETRLAKLEEWRHGTSNRLQVLVSQLDDIRTRKT